MWMNYINMDVRTGFPLFRTDKIPWYLPPATKLGQGYVFTRVCNSVHKGGGGCLPHCMLGYTHVPWDQRQAAPPPPDQAPNGSWHHPEPATPGPVHAGRYGQQAAGMHPTGMQSCSKIFPGFSKFPGIFSLFLKYDFQVVLNINMQT